MNTVILGLDLVKSLSSNGRAGGLRKRGWKGEWKTITWYFGNIKANLNIVQVICFQLIIYYYAAICLLYFIPCIIKPAHAENESNLPYLSKALKLLWFEF